MSRLDAASGGGNNSSGSAAAGQPKQLSSRLMTMKFMQRAAATKGAGTGAGTGASPGSGPQTPASEPPSKRRRVESTNSAASTPGRLSDSELGPVVTPERSARTIYARQGEETEWVLNIVLPKGIARFREDDDSGEDEDDEDGDEKEEDGEEGEEEDDDDDDDDEENEINTVWPAAATGRQTYGSFQKKTDRKDKGTGADADNGANNDDDLSSVSGSLSDLEDDDRHTPAGKAGPGGQQPLSARGRGRGRGRGGSSGNGGGYSNRNRNSSYGGSASWSPLTKLPNSKERRRQNRTATQQRKQARKTL